MIRPSQLGLELVLGWAEAQQGWRLWPLGGPLPPVAHPSSHLHLSIATISDRQVRCIKEKYEKELNLYLLSSSATHFLIQLLYFLVVSGLPEPFQRLSPFSKAALAVSNSSK